MLFHLERGQRAKQAWKEFEGDWAPDVNRKFTESSRLVIAAIQRVDSMLKVNAQGRT